MHVYHSCRNRHCPKCQHLAREKWLQEREKELLPVKYFHIIFTVPGILNEIALFNKTLFYEVLFSSVNYTMSFFAGKNKWMGAQYGAIAILHSWGQNLSYHPHLHLAVPAGGIAWDKMEWRGTRKNFFAPVKEMSKTFSEKFCQLLKAKLDKRNLSEETGKKFDNLIESAKLKKWVVFAQKPFANPGHIIDYLGNYTHRVAISNSRLIKLENGYVYFKYKDYRKNGERKPVRLPVMEFIRRFLQHVLPAGFRKIRYFGFLSNRFKNQYLGIARSCLKNEGTGTVAIRQSLTKGLSKIGLQLNILTGTFICPACGGDMVALSTAYNDDS